jgi:membrane-bound lytic murein transglycosylase D
VKYPDFELKVPAGTGGQFQTRLADATPSELAALKFHVVKRGETLATIARKQRVSRADLAAANGLSTRSRVRISQQLVIPSAPATLLATRTERAAPVELASRSIGETTEVAQAATPERVVYRVKRGDTLFGIARLFDTTVAQIKAWNRLRSNTLAIGTRLTIHSTPSR